MKKTKNKKIYQTITNEKRMTIVTMILSGISLISVAKKLKINYSTIKSIIRLFRHERRIFRKDSKYQLYPNKVITSTQDTQNYVQTINPNIYISYFFLNNWLKI